MSHLSYKRVNRKRVCLVCGKPDWCSFTPDEKISFCARIIQNANRVSRTGWGVFYHENSFSDFQTLPCPKKHSAKKPELAPIEIRDFAYRKLIELAPATNSNEIINGPKGLRERKILDFENYGSLPQNQTVRTAIARKIRRLINQNFPNYVRKEKSSFTGVPGFWFDNNGKARLWWDKDYFYPLMIIPYRNKNGLIAACQMRFMRDLRATVRYLWLSTPDKSNGLSSGSHLHFATGFEDNNSPDKPILVTEGALKAQTIQNFLPNFSVLANGGVTCSHTEIITNSRFRPLFIAFDADYRHNRHVARAFAGLINLRILDAEKHNYSTDVSIVKWSTTQKGFDDALLNRSPFSLMTIADWFKSLDKFCQQEITFTY